MIVNEGAWETFEKRTQIKYTRNILNKQGYMEVETPILQPIAGGAAARPFITHLAHRYSTILKNTNELYLKRLIVGGKNGFMSLQKI